MEPELVSEILDSWSPPKEPYTVGRPVIVVLSVGLVAALIGMASVAVALSDTNQSVRTLKRQQAEIRADAEKATVPLQNSVANLRALIVGTTLPVGAGAVETSLSPLFGKSVQDRLAEMRQQLDIACLHIAQLQDAAQGVEHLFDPQTCPTAP
jgi:Na+-transporting NADH:ubiquinone oxidoreductase subunit NqrC